MTPKELKKLILQTLEEHKAVDIVDLDIRKLTNIADYMIICSGISSRHVHTLAENLVITTKKNGVRPLGVEEDADREWTLVDLGDVIVHIMLPEIREFYELEKLWGGDVAKTNRKK